MNNLQDLAPWAESFINTLSPKEQKALYRKLALALRKQNQKRLSKQQNPDGTKWQPRKKRIDRGSERKEGKVAKQKKMMLGLRKAKHMKVQANRDGATVGYEGRIAEIARVHHYGLSEHSKWNNSTIRYPERELLGITENNKKMLINKFIKAFSRSA